MNNKINTWATIKEGITLVGSFASIFAFIFGYTRLIQLFKSNSPTIITVEQKVVDNRIYIGFTLIACSLFIILSIWATISFARVIIHLFRRLA